MSDTWRENAIVLAIDLIVNKRISQASFDKTIKAVVEECTDATIGEYKIKYQDSIFTAYAGAEVHYQPGTQVFILVPKNDMSSKKLITGAVTQSTYTFSLIPQAENLYNKVGINVLKQNQEIIGLSSYRDEIRDIYVDDGKDYPLSIDQLAIERYIKLGNGLSAGCYVQTKFDSSQTGGVYGLIFNLRFRTESGGPAAVRPYHVKSSDIVGNPYSLTAPTLFELYINDIDIESFDGIQSIQIFDEGFKDKVKEGEQGKEDILFSKFFLFGVEGLSLQALNGYSLHIDYSKTGNVIKVPSAGEVSSITLTADMKIKGKIIQEDVNYYWFKLNGTIFKGSSKWSEYGGDGWETLNPYTATENKPLPGPKNLIFTSGNQAGVLVQEDSTWVAACPLKSLKIKCVAVYKEKNVSSSRQEDTCTIYNNIINNDIVITSSDTIKGLNKTVYYLNNGSPTLTCRVYEKRKLVNIHSEDSKDIYTFQWSIIPANGTMIQNIGDKGPAKVLDYSEYNAALKKYKDALANYDRVDQNSKQREEQQSYWSEEIANIQEEWETATGGNSYIVDNVYYNFPISSIQNFTKIICAVSKQSSQEDPVYIGSSSIILYNKPTLSGMYSLNLNEGDQVFQYDDKGNSPASLQLQKPLVIKPLTFTLLDNTGTEVPYEQILQFGEIRWVIPNTQTLLSYNGQGEVISGEQDLIVSHADLALPALSYKVYKNLLTFPFSIAPSYDSKNNINYIWLIVRYKEITLDAYTNFSFPKQGDPGTNGTDYVAKLSTSPLTLSIYVTNIKGANGNLADTFGDSGSKINNIEFLLFNNSKLVDPQPTPTVNILKTSEDKNNFIKISTQDGKKNVVSNKTTTEPLDLENYNSLLESIKKSVNIIRAQVQLGGSLLKYYSELPIYYEYITGSSGIYPNFRIKLKPKTGFKYVMYAEDGTSPEYDNTLPFTIVVEKLEQIPSRSSSSDDDDKYYYSSLEGYDSLKFKWSVNNADLFKETKDLGNKFYVVPADKFDGQNLTAAIICEVEEKTQLNIYKKIGFIHMPIYMYLNRYGHAALNEWDGNSIDLKLDSDGKPTGSTILAPQVGAGKKNNDNTFTGVLMGVQHTPKEGDAQEKNLTGLFGFYHGDRTIFLDSETGKALFGKNNAGKIILDPSKQINGKDLALIYSNTYPINLFIELPDVKTIGNNHHKDEDDNLGMIIDLSTPQIGFGNGNFSVSKNGHITARGGGNIAGWTISDDSLYSHNDKYQTGMTSTGEPAFYAGASTQSYNPNNTNTYNFSVTHDGYLYSKQGQIGGWNITPTKLFHDSYRKNENDEWVKDQLDIVGLSAPLNPVSTHIAFYAGGSPNNRDKFYVRYDGYLRSTTGQIANWTIAPYSLTDGSVGLGSTTFSNDDNNPFKLAINAKIWGKNGDTLNFALSDNGKLYANAGKIAGWNVSSTALKAGNDTDGWITINSNGSLSGGTGKKGNPSWQINKNGSATFYNLVIKDGSFVLGDSTINKGSFKVGPFTSVYNITTDSNGNPTGGTQSGTIDSSCRVGNSAYRGKNNSDLSLDAWGETLARKIINAERVSAEGMKANGFVLTSGSNYDNTTGEFKEGSIIGSFNQSGLWITTGDIRIGGAVKPNSGKKGRSGKITFSDGSFMEFAKGILVDIGKGGSGSSGGGGGTMVQLYE